jgi:hypothetical protein
MKNFTQIINLILMPSITLSFNFKQVLSKKSLNLELGMVLIAKGGLPLAIFL